LRDYTEGVLEGLAWSLTVAKRESKTKTAGKISRQILRILEAQAEDFDSRIQVAA
jgi:hypothetical protein